MLEFKIASGINSEEIGLDPIIPTGSLIMKAVSPTVLSNYATVEQCIQAGVVPCDGRFLYSYQFNNLHSVISNLYSGDPFIGAVPSPITKTVTSFNTTTNLALQRFVTLFFDNSDGAIVNNMRISVPGYDYGYFVYGVTSTSASFQDSLFLFNSPPTAPFEIKVSYGFNLPDLRNYKYYIGGATEVQKETPALSFGTNTLTHNHTYSVPGPVNIASATGNNHTHSVSHVSAGLNTSHTHYVEGGYNGNTGQQAPNYTQSKVDGTGSASASNHSHGVAVNFAGNSAGTTYNRDHSHNGSGNSGIQNVNSNQTHAHTATTNNVDSLTNQFTISGSGHSPLLPFVNVLYFIKT
jgi:hypothetical protein